MFQDPLVARVPLSKHRLEALADGVFAIAVTLIVLEIKVPDLPRNASMDVIMHALKPQIPALFAYLVTFMICGTFWFLHQMSFHWIARIDRGLVFINIGYLMFVSLMPFSTSMFAHFLGSPAGEIFYFGNATVIAVFLNLHWWHAQRRGFLTEDDGAHVERKLFQQRIQVFLLAFVVTTALTPLIPQWVGIAPGVVVLLQRRRERRLLAVKA